MQESESDVLKLQMSIWNHHAEEDKNWDYFAVVQEKTQTQTNFQKLNFESPKYERNQASSFEQDAANTRIKMKALKGSACGDVIYCTCTPKA